MRDFQTTREPRGGATRRTAPPRGASFVIQRHEASRLHWDFRLEMDGVLKSWAVPKEPSLDPKVKRLAVHVEDHPLEYGSFQGSIPAGQYGAGEVRIWDRGRWIPDGDPRAAYAKGHLAFRLEGRRLTGRFHLVRTRLGSRRGASPRSGGKENWLLFRGSDAAVSAKGPAKATAATRRASRSSPRSAR
jgi:bifunctional non-homologous end joining protein LigD